MAIKWTKKDVITKFRDAMESLTPAKPKESKGEYNKEKMVQQKAT
jgi:hypothetical protein